MEHKKNGFSVTKLMNLLDTKLEKSLAKTETLRQVLYSRNTQEVTASSDQLIALLEDMPQTVENYIKELGMCRELTGKVRKMTAQPKKARLL